VTKSHSRPHTSHDNPYSESQFKTLKHRAEFPDRFGCFEDAHAFCARFFGWYNDEHRHSRDRLPLDFPPLAGHCGYAARVDGSGWSCRCWRSQSTGGR
jgi:Integrase core domain